MSCPRLVGHLGIWGASNVYPQAAEQRCWNHKIVNVLAKLPKRQQDQAKLMLRTAPTRREAERLRTVFTRWCGDHSRGGLRGLGAGLGPHGHLLWHWGHLRRRTVESPRPSGTDLRVSGDSGEADGRRRTLQASEGPFDRRRLPRCTYAWNRH